MGFYVPPARGLYGTHRVPITTCCHCGHNQIDFRIAPFCGNCEENGNGYRNEMLWDELADKWVSPDYYYLGC